MWAELKKKHKSWKHIIFNEQNTKSESRSALWEQSSYQRCCHRSLGSDCHLNPEISPHPPMISPTLGWESRLLISKGARRDRRAQIALMWVIFICHKLGWAFFHQLNPVELLGWMQLDKLHKEHHLHGNLTGSKNKSTQNSLLGEINTTIETEWA